MPPIRTAWCNCASPFCLPRVACSWRRVLTLLTRSSVAGFVFSIAVPGAIAVACELAATANLLSSDPEQFNDIRLAGLSGGMLVTSLAGAMSTAWMFTRVEAVEGGRAIGLAPAWRSTSSRTTVAPAHPIAQLIRKELHIQQMSFVVAALFVLASGSVGLFLILHREISARSD